MAQRHEDPHQTGMINQAGIGSFRALSGVTLNTRIIPPAGGPVLPGHATLEPAVLDPRDVAGVVLDAAPRLVLDGSGIFRMKGRIVAPALAGAATINVQHGGDPVLQWSPVAPDGSFSIMGSPGQGPGRYMLRVFLNYPDGSNAKVAEFRNVQYFGGVRVPPPPVALTATAAGNTVSIQWAPDSGSPPTNYFLDVGSSSGASDLAVVAVRRDVILGFRCSKWSLLPSRAGGEHCRRERALGRGRARRWWLCVSAAADARRHGDRVDVDAHLAAQPDGRSGVHDPRRIDERRQRHRAGARGGGDDIDRPGRAARPLLRSRAGGDALRECRLERGGASSSARRRSLARLATLTHQVAGSTVSFFWQAASGSVGGYVLEAGSVSGSANLAAVPVGNVLALSVPGVPPGTYYVRVRAANAAGQGPPSNEVVVVVP